MKLSNTTTSQPLQTTSTPPADSTSKKAVGQLPPKDSIQSSSSYYCCNPIVDFFWRIINFFKSLFGCGKNDPLSKPKKQPPNDLMQEQKKHVTQLLLHLDNADMGRQTAERLKSLNQAIEMIQPNGHYDLKIYGGIPLLFFIVLAIDHRSGEHKVQWVTLFKKILDTNSINLTDKDAASRTIFDIAYEYKFLELASMILEKGGEAVSNNQESIDHIREYMQTQSSLKKLTESND